MVPVTSSECAVRSGPHPPRPLVPSFDYPPHSGSAARPRPSVAPAVSAKSRVFAHACGARVEWVRHNNSSTNIRNNNRNISNNKINEIALVAELKLCFT